MQATPQAKPWKRTDVRCVDSGDSEQLASVYSTIAGPLAPSASLSPTQLQSLETRLYAAGELLQQRKPRGHCANLRLLDPRPAGVCITLILCEEIRLKSCARGHPGLAASALAIEPAA